ncbi:neprilysin-1-like [Amblyomma americanum]
MRRQATAYLIANRFQLYARHRQKMLCWLLLALKAVWFAKAADQTLFPGRSPTPRTLCESSVCKERAQIILASVNQTADPCDDFYAYVCNRWSESHPIPDDLTTMSPFVQVTLKVEQDLREILESLPVVPVATTAREKAAVAYHACMNTSISEEEGLKAVRRVLERNGIGKWPILDDKDAAEVGELKDIVERTSLTSLFTVQIAKDMDNLTSYILQLGQRPNTNIETCDSCWKDPSTTPATKFLEVSQAAAKLLTPGATQRQLKAFARSMLSFFSNLDSAQQPHEDRRNLRKNYCKNTIEELEEHFPGLDLFELLKTEFLKVNITIRKDEKIVVNARAYVDKTVQLFLLTKPKVVYNYLGLFKVLAMLPLVSKEFDALHGEFRHIVYGVAKNHPRWMTCIQKLQNIMKDTIGRLYTEQKLSKEIKAEGELLVRKIARTYYSGLRHLVWMDHETREKARNKLLEMKHRVAYPDTFLSDDYIDEKFNDVGELKKYEHFVEISDRFETVAYLQLLATLRESASDTDEWSLSASEDVNAYYSPDTNEIVIPGGILQDLFFQEGLPSYMNLGSIGAIIGHEITHGYDDEGSQYDGKGRLIDWWSNETEQEFNAKKDCFIHQYGNIVDPATKESINGENTVGENIADNGGVRVAFATHARLSDDGAEEVLPGLEGFSPEQLFFISYALVWCRSTRPEIGEELMTDVHSPNMYRVNVPLRNMDEFTAAFECRAGARMRSDPKNACVLW